MKLVLMGTGTFAEPAFDRLMANSHEVVCLVTQPDKGQGTKAQIGRAHV